MNSSWKKTLAKSLKGVITKSDRLICIMDRQKENERAKLCVIQTLSRLENGFLARGWIVRWTSQHKTAREIRDDPTLSCWVAQVASAFHAQGEISLIYFLSKVSLCSTVAFRRAGDPEFQCFSSSDSFLWMMNKHQDFFGDLFSMSYTFSELERIVEERDHIRNRAIVAIDCMERLETASQGHLAFWEVPVRERVPIDQRTIERLPDELECFAALQSPEGSDPFKTVAGALTRLAAFASELANSSIEWRPRIGGRLLTLEFVAVLIERNSLNHNDFSALQETRLDRDGDLLTNVSTQSLLVALQTRLAKTNQRTSA